MQTNKKLSLIYEILIVLLAVLSIVLLILSFRTDLASETQRALSLSDTVILIFFAADYFIRLVMAKNKWQFIKSNVFDLLSIIPFNQAFRAFRIARLTRIFRLLKAGRVVVLLGKVGARSRSFFETNHFNYVLYITVATVFLGALGIYLTEGKDFGDALWWSFVTTTTVGYGDISPESGLGRIIAVVLMLVGIGFIGSLTSTLATYFLRPKRSAPKTLRDETLDNIKARLDNFDHLNDADVDELCTALKQLKQ